MPKLMVSRLVHDATEERQIRKIGAKSTRPADWITRARMIVRSWDGLRTTIIATELGSHPQTVRERLLRFNAEGTVGLGDRSGAGRKPRLTEVERSQVIVMVTTDRYWCSHRTVLSARLIETTNGC